MNNPAVLRAPFAKTPEEQAKEPPTPHLGWPLVHWIKNCSFPRETIQWPIGQASANLANGLTSGRPGRHHKADNPGQPPVNPGHLGRALAAAVAATGQPRPTPDTPTCTRWGGGDLQSADLVDRPQSSTPLDTGKG